MSGTAMADESATLSVRLVRKPIHSIFWHFAVACFIGALATDITYSQTAEMMWANFSAWLLAAGLAIGVLATLLCVFDLLTRRLVGVNRLTWPNVIGSIVVFTLAFLNSLVHSRDAWTSVVPMGLILSAITVIVLLVAGLLGRLVSYRRAVGVVADA
jgi:uncharacterized membrane protein